jgi:hypothetical protein
MTNLLDLRLTAIGTVANDANYFFRHDRATWRGTADIAIQAPRSASDEMSELRPGGDWTRQKTELVRVPLF